MMKTMLQVIREKLSGWVLFLIVGILIVPFAFLGIGDYFSSSVSTYVAKVDEDEISTDRVREAMTRQRQQYRQTFGEEMDLSFLSAPESLFRRSVSAKTRFRFRPSRWPGSSIRISTRASSLPTA